jgi:hypothetical protein
MPDLFATSQNEFRRRLGVVRAEMLDRAKERRYLEATEEKRRRAEILLDRGTLLANVCEDCGYRKERKRMPVPETLWTAVFGGGTPRYFEREEETCACDSPCSEAMLSSLIRRLAGIWPGGQPKSAPLDEWRNALAGKAGPRSCGEVAWETAVRTIEERDA